MVGCKLATILVLIWSYLHIRRRKLDDIQVSVSVRLPLLIVYPYSEIQILIVKKYCIFLPSILSLFFKYNINLFVLIGSYLLYNVVLVLHTLTWIHLRCTRVPHPEPPSHLSPHCIPLGHPSAPAPSILYHALNLDCWFVSHMIIYMFQWHSLKSSYPCPLPQSPKDCSIHPMPSSPCVSHPVHVVWAKRLSYTSDAFISLCESPCPRGLSEMEHAGAAAVGMWRSTGEHSIQGLLTGTVTGQLTHKG